MNRSRLKKSAVLLLALALLLPLLSFSLAPRAAASYDGYYVDAWTVEGDYGSTVTYYRMYKSSADRIGEPTFYSDSASDEYNNIYTGWDVTFRFYRPYLSPTREQAAAFYQYLLAEALGRNHEGYAGWFSSVDAKTGYERIFCYLIDGWNLDNTNRDLQDLWDRNPWMNGNAGLMELEYLGYGDVSKDNWDYIYNTCNCSFSLWFQRSTGWGGITAGFRFMEGTEDTPVRKYCYYETYTY